MKFSSTFFHSVDYHKNVQLILLPSQRYMIPYDALYFVSSLAHVFL